MLFLGAIAVLWFTTPAIAAPWMGLYPVLAETTDPTPSRKVSPSDGEDACSSSRERY